jgi:hypothetical protein
VLEQPQSFKTEASTANRPAKCDVGGLVQSSNPACVANVPLQRRTSLLTYSPCVNLQDKKDKGHRHGILLLLVNLLVCEKVPQAKSNIWAASSRAQICGYDPLLA